MGTKQPNEARRGPLARTCRALGRLDAHIDATLRRSLTPKQAKLWLLATSLLFAGLMLGVSWLLRDSEVAQTWIYCLIALWWIPYSLLASISGDEPRGRCRRGA